MADEPAVVLDASALLLVLNEEPGADVVAPLLGSAVVSAVNLSEVVSTLAHRGVPGAAIEGILTELALDVRPFDATAALSAGLLRPATASRGLSLGDRACLALAKELDAVAVTADRAWKGLRVGVKIRLAR